jgi:hypothetical protein
VTSQPDSLFAVRTSESKSVRKKLGCEAMRLETPSKLISVTIHMVLPIPNPTIHTSGTSKYPL